MEESELLKRLDGIAALKSGDPIPDWMSDMNNSWGTSISEICRESAAKIRFLRSVAGAVSQ